jgi:FAD dependent oxidoreductase
MLPIDEYKQHMANEPERHASQLAKRKSEISSTEPSKSKIAVAGAGIYGATIAIRLAEQGHEVHLFDPLGVLLAASAINQFRVHSGYHYPRSPETIVETMEAHAEFLQTFQPAIVRGTRHFYAIPKQHSLTPPDLFETVMGRHNLPLRPCRPAWMNFDFIDACYEVQEHIYDPDLLRGLIVSRIRSRNIRFEQRAFSPEIRDDYDFVVWAVYGLSHSRGFFKGAKYQVAEKILIELPEQLRGVSLIVLDGPFTAFDPYGNSPRFLFGSARHTNHWTSLDPDEAPPEPYAGLLNGPAFEPVAFSHFEAMRRDAALSVSAAEKAVYCGSRFTIRVVEDNSKEDRRTLYVKEGVPGELHIFSGKVVSAVKAARMVCAWIAKNG